MNYLSAESLAKSYHDQWLFKDINFGISQGEKIALVGHNGAGKSTFLKILTGIIEPDIGQVSIAQGIRLGFLVQQPHVDPEVTVEQLLFDHSSQKGKVVRAYEAALLNPDTSVETIQHLLEEMERLNAWEYENQLKEVIGKLGVPELHKKFGELSGGQKKRIFLAQLLLEEPDLLILDEPTNHLDLEAIEWLENYLSGQKITLLMVTHDRYFLDNVVTEIIEIDREQLYRYRGNYAYFLEKKSQREEILKAEVAKARNLLKKELEWMRRQPKARGTKAKYRIDAFHELKEKASETFKKDKLELDIQETRLGGKILEVKQLEKKFDNRPIVHNFTYTFKKGDRIGIVGKNGVGKSTFLNLLTGLELPDAGKVDPGATLKIGYFTQEVNNLNPTHRIIEEVKEIAEFITLADGSQVSASKFLDLFLFPPEKQYTFIDKLSGGEKKRLQLLKILVTNPNFLILDEPTNDFDIDTLNVLEDFLEKFSGCLLLVSHDRYFMDQLVDQLFVFEGNGSITLFNGNYSDYRLQAQQEPEEVLTATKTPVKTPEVVKSNPSKQKASYKEQQEYEQLTSQIADLEQQKQALIEILSQGNHGHGQLQHLSVQIEQLDQAIENKTLRWMELAEKIEG